MLCRLQSRVVGAWANFDLGAFHARCLGPGQAAVVVAGDVEPETLADELDRHLAAWDGQEGRVLGRCEARTGLEPFGRLVQQVMEHPD